MTVLALDDARRAIIQAVPALQPIELPLAEAYGCVAAADATAEYDLPAFSAAEIDGFAARAADIDTASDESPVRLKVSGWALAGRPPEVTVGWGEAVRIAGGAPIPAGADCIVPPGSFSVEGEFVQVTESGEPGRYIRPAGEDVRAGSVLVPAGRRLSAAELGMLATAGYGSVLAYPKLRVGVLSIGELIEPGRPTAFGQVRDAASYLLLGSIRDIGAVPYRIGIVTDVERQLRDAVLSNTLRVDAFLVAGRPESEQVGTILAGLGDITEHRVAVHPGSAIGYGLVEGMPFFHVSGRPAGAFVGFETFVRPAVLRMMGRQAARPEVRAVLDEPVSGPAGVALFVPARLIPADDGWHCRPTGPADEDRLAAIVQANGLIAVPPGDEGVAAGERVRVQVFRPLER